MQDESKAKTPLAPPAAAEKAADYSQQAFVIEKYLTKIRFENNGTSQREQIIRDVRARPVVARLATDADLDELRAVEPVLRGDRGLLQ